MRSIILAAGKGTRMGKYCTGRPKGMLPFLGRPLIDWQLHALRKAGLADISIVTGYAADTVDFPGVRLFHNAQFDSTNMVASLLTAELGSESALLVSYADVLFESRLVEGMSAVDADVLVAADSDWHDLWRLRYGTIEQDLESFQVDGDRIIEIGTPCYDPCLQQLRYVGLIKFSAKAVAALSSLVRTKAEINAAWRPSGKPFPQGYMTDLIFELLEQGLDVRAYPTKRGWLEFDTEDDYEKITGLAEQGKLETFIKLGS